MQVQVVIRSGKGREKREERKVIDTTRAGYLLTPKPPAAPSGRVAGVQLLLASETTGSREQEPAPTPKPLRSRYDTRPCGGGNRPPWGKRNR